ncbi:MAG TPA: response regulator [Candidatus Xenobia bacterium]|nr:response regulator [Candidatus Xenobia bacterium]
MGAILIVEDNPSVAKFYSLSLERSGGFRCLQARSAEEVLELCQSGEVDLILLDISLAGFTYKGQAIDGLVLSHLVKNDPATRHIPVLLATAHAMEGDRERFLAASGADDYLQKPIYDPAELVEKVRALLKRRSPSDVG